MAASHADELARLVRRMQEERQQHVAALAEIDATFGSLGIAPQPVKRRGRKPGRPAGAAASAASATSAASPASAAPAAPKVKGRRRRRMKAKDGKTAEQFLLEVLTGERGLTTSQVNSKWAESGRNGRADIMLGKLVADSKLKRQKVKGERGSRYNVA